MGGSDYKKRLKTLISAAEEQQWNVSKTSGGHWRFVPPDKQQNIVIAPATTRDHRAVANLEADLRRSGLSA
jgi:hypothetical protein